MNYFHLPRDFEPNWLYTGVHRNPIIFNTMQTVTITGEDLSKIHNAGCKLHHLVEKLTQVVAPSIIAELVEANELLQAGLENSRNQSDEMEDEFNDKTRAIAEEKDFSTVWSVGKIVDMNSVIPFTQATELVYTNFWHYGGDTPKSLSATIKPNSTWVDLWALADQLILRSKDMHHTFIEDFEPSGNTLILRTGS